MSSLRWIAGIPSMLPVALLLLPPFLGSNFAATDSSLLGTICGIMADGRVAQSCRVF